MNEAAQPSRRTESLRGNYMTARSITQVESNRIQGLDAIRGLAILLVLLRHAWPETFGNAGIVGVVVFFTLSGYLITGLLERDIRAYGHVRFSRFYLHRIFRLMPALIFMLAGFAFIEGIWNILGDRELVFQSILVGMTYTMNLPGIEHGSGAVNHLWTLATEEQFYLLWPLVLTFGIRKNRAVLTTWAAIILSMILCAVSIFVVFPETYKIYSLPTSWVAAMLIGAVAKLMEARLNGLLRGISTRATAMSALVILLSLSFVPDAKNWPGTYLLVGPLIAFCAVALIMEGKSWIQVPSMTLKPLLWLGTVSYAAYLWNYPIANWIGDRPLDLLQGVASIALTLLAATLSWYAVEKPSSRLRGRLDVRRDESKEVPPAPLAKTL